MTDTPISKTLMSPQERNYKFLPSWAWLVLIMFLTLIGGIGGALAEHFRLVCLIDKDGFKAKTTVCTDGQAYALIPMSVDVKLLEQKLANYKSQLEACNCSGPK